jgi:hypothetical protein
MVCYTLIFGSSIDSCSSGRSRRGSTAMKPQQQHQEEHRSVAPTPGPQLPVRCGCQPCPARGARGSSGKVPALSPRAGGSSGKVPALSSRAGGSSGEVPARGRRGCTRDSRPPLLAMGPAARGCMALAGSAGIRSSARHASIAGASARSAGACSLGVRSCVGENTVACSAPLTRGSSTMPSQEDPLMGTCRPRGGGGTLQGQAWL